MHSLLFRVGGEEAGRRLDEFLAGRVFRLSRTHIAAAIGRGACTVNGEAARAGRRLAEGDAVEVALPDEAPDSMTPEPVPLEVAYEDEHLVVVVKPAGMLVHPTRGVKTGTLANALTYHLNRMLIDDLGSQVEAGQPLNSQPRSDEGVTRNLNPLTAIHDSKSVIRGRRWVRPGIVHRLDRDTSGLLVVAKTQAALSRLSGHFHRRLVEKRYLALLHGHVEADEQVVNAPVGRDPDARPAWRVKADGKQAETRLRVLERRGGSTLVELEPVTGRTNQLRIHCAHAGHPIVGDPLYGADDHPRLCLHAARLAFHHPASNEWVEFTSPLPQDILAAGT